MTFSAKVLNDLTGVAQGYRDHIALCQSIIDSGREELMGDGLGAAQSLQAHLGFVEELATFLAGQGAKTAEVVAEEIIAALVPEAPKQE